MMVSSYKEILDTVIQAIGTVMMIMRANPVVSTFSVVDTKNENVTPQQREHFVPLKSPLHSQNSRIPKTIKNTHRNGFPNQNTHTAATKKGLAMGQVVVSKGNEKLRDLEIQTPVNGRMKYTVVYTKQYYL
eukprot:scaffold6421_cov251-Ochromonas_danica.AAC.22